MLLCLLICALLHQRTLQVLLLVSLSLHYLHAVNSQGVCTEAFITATVPYSVEKICVGDSCTCFKNFHLPFVFVLCEHCSLHLLEDVQPLWVASQDKDPRQCNPKLIPLIRISNHIMRYLEL